MINFYTWYFRKNRREYFRPATAWIYLYSRLYLRDPLLLISSRVDFESTSCYFRWVKVGPYDTGPGQIGLRQGVEMDRCAQWYHFKLTRLSWKDLASAGSDSDSLGGGILTILNSKKWIYIFLDLRHEFTPPILEMIVIRYENKPLGILHLLSRC